MKSFLDFLFKYSHWAIYLFLSILSLYWVYSKNPIQRYSMFNSSNSWAGSIYRAANEFESYRNLKGENEQLLGRINELENKIRLYEAQADQMQLGKQDSLLAGIPTTQFQYVTAQVVNNSIYKSLNYITLDKGEVDGIKPEMGVVNQNGVVGVISYVGKHFSTAISILNPQLRLSCKIKGSNFFGSMVWDGEDAQHVSLEELPLHAKFSVGDTIVTSGYSLIFPEGTVIGKISSSKKGDNANYLTLKVELLSDIANIKYVNIIGNVHQSELKEVEETNKENLQSNK